jgi:hypothetical protein
MALLPLEGTQATFTRQSANVVTAEASAYRLRHGTPSRVNHKSPHGLLDGTGRRIRSYPARLAAPGSLVGGRPRP